MQADSLRSLPRVRQLRVRRVQPRTRRHTGTAETGYCYDAADRLVATHGALQASFAYDAAGNTIAITEGSNTTYLGWDSAGRHLTARTTGPEPASVAYQRDVTDRIIRRDVTAEGDTGQVLYGYLGDGDAAALTLDVDKRLLTRTLVLPGGVLYTMHGSAQPADPGWDHPSVRDDLVLSTDNSGAQVGPLRTYGPYGQPLAADGTVNPDGVPDNQPGEMDYGWLGQNQRPYEHAGSLALVQMGARPYSPLLGRFLAVDPDPAGSANDYEYVGANPINTLDITGENWFTDAIGGVWNGIKAVGNGIATAGKWAWNHRTEIATGAVGVGCVFMTAGACTVAGGLLWIGTTADEYISTGTIDKKKAIYGLMTLGAAAVVARTIAGGWRARNVVQNRQRPPVQRSSGRHRAPVNRRATAGNWGINAVQSATWTMHSYSSGRKVYCFRNVLCME